MKLNVTEIESTPLDDMLKRLRDWQGHADLPLRQYGKRSVNRSSPSALTQFQRADIQSVEWEIASDLVSYPDAIGRMEERVSAITEGRADELIWLIEHPPLYTAGTSSNHADLVDQRFPVFETGRGGQYTYHGPGQRVRLCND